MAVISEMISGESERKPALKKMSVLRPGTSDRFLASPESASSTERAPKSPFTPPMRGPPAVSGPPIPVLETMAELRTPATICFRRSMSSVKFCAICSHPP